ncbi:hypothetical protein DOY81_000224 [Sarcophaga bullata]|nr:hypothetical protein DOY81_000224 [Sarcophaga bullata]
MLFQKEWQQHQKTTIVHDPPDVNITANLKIRLSYNNNPMSTANKTLLTL